MKRQTTRLKIIPVGAASHLGEVTMLNYKCPFFFFRKKSSICKFNLRVTTPRFFRLRFDSRNRIMKWALGSILILAAVFRLAYIGSIPGGMFGDEVDAGYNAYSLLKTGHDYNGNWWPTHIESMGDWRPFLYIYSLIPWIGILGLTRVLKCSVT